MSDKAARLRAHHQQLVETARSGLTKRPDGSVSEKELRTALALLLPPPDPTAEAQKRAQQIIDSLSKQVGEDADEIVSTQLNLFGDSYGHDLKRLVKDLDGNIIEHGAATLKFAEAELTRSSQHTARVTNWNTRKGQQVIHFKAWTDAQLARGRDPKQLTWGNCVRETGVLQRVRS